MSEVVQIIPTGIDRERPIFLLKKFPPHKIYIIKNKSPPEEHKEMEETRGKIIKELEDLTPLAEKEHVKINYYDFKESFIKLLEIMKKEKDKGNRVIVNLSPPSRIVAFAAWIASSLTDSEAYYIHGKVYGLGGEFHTKGIGGLVKVFHFPITLPDEIEGNILGYLLKEKDVSTNLRRFVKSLSLKKLGEVTTIQSGIVKLSYALRGLEEKGYIEMDEIGGKRRKISLTESGEMMAKAVEILHRNKP
ncbi:MAG: hypothetical protein GF368_06065 [Candidatus Aenigmarchaeota archaeon]|nr:hypothetical protein [Candidatus Aenigmarchaeota archaeon]